MCRYQWVRRCAQHIRKENTKITKRKTRRYQRMMRCPVCVVCFFSQQAYTSIRNPCICGMSLFAQNRIDKCTENAINEFSDFRKAFSQRFAQNITTKQKRKPGRRIKNSSNGRRESSSSSEHRHCNDHCVSYSYMYESTNISFFSLSTYCLYHIRLRRVCTEQRRVYSDEFLNMSRTRKIEFFRSPLNCTGTHIRETFKIRIIRKINCAKGMSIGSVHACEWWIRKGRHDVEYQNKNSLKLGIEPLLLLSFLNLSH